MPIHTTHTRDAALRQLHRINRWLIAGSVVLTGVFADAAAHAFPGRTTKTATASKVKRSGAHTSAPHTTTTHSLQPPNDAPQATTESSSSPESAAPSQESTTTRETAPTHESRPAEESAPVVSGGS
jgi:hypothetical protein